MSSQSPNPRRIKLGVVANEFFDLRLGRMGGFGWAARQVARCLKEDPSLGVEVVFLTNASDVGNGRHETTVHETRLVSFNRGRLDNLRRLRAERLDLLLGIDYRPNYRFFYHALPRTPIITWVRAPRTPEDMAGVKSLCFPEPGAAPPGGVEPIDCTSLARVVQLSRLVSRPVLFATPAPHLADKCEGAYGVKKSELFFLPNIIDLHPVAEEKSARPRVVFLGRLDPNKRPWLFVELARQFPHVEFLFLGQAHFESGVARGGEGTPPNVRFMGHVGEAEKARALSSAWALVNTSLHEGLAVSFLEALACETPILSCQNPGGVVSRFGFHAGEFGGAGLEAVPRLAEGLRRLLDDGELRLRLGREGRSWVRETHSRARFVRAFRVLLRAAGREKLSGS
ncbi:MAG: glycosyltransferase family 4 protein [Acidobacteria bacterium]|nr:glycosyltransferase family 4 protein [Acidobacteriota bacterium]